MSKKDFYTIKFPLEIGIEDVGYQQISDFKELVEYNMKSTLLTCPGEIISDPQFGVCIRKVLFENPNTISNLDYSLCSKEARLSTPFEP